jgi:hypothetical protein
MLAFATVTRYGQSSGVSVCKRKGGERKREEKEKEEGRGIKYGIVGIEYGIEITWVQEK